MQEDIKAQDKWIQEMERISSLSQNAMKETCVDLPITILYVNLENQLEEKKQDSITLHFLFDTSGNPHQKTFATKEVLLKKMCDYKKNGKQIDFQPKSEKDIFDYLQIAYVKPENRK